MSDKQQEVERAVLDRRTKGWTIQYVQDVPLPADVPYASGQAWGVCVMKQWNELGDEPEWLQGTDEETHQLYYQQRYKEMGKAAETVSRIELDLVISTADQFHVFPCKPVQPTEEMKARGMTIAFTLEFPEQLP